MLLVETPLEREETLALRWPSAPAPKPRPVAGFRLDFRVDRRAFERVQREAGWELTDPQWTELSARLVPDSMVFVDAASAPVGVACALDRGGALAELSWVAVSPRHRGIGLGAMVCAALTERLVAKGRDVFLSTQDERIAALAIYLSLGFHPLYRVGKEQRWQRLCSALGRPFEPQTWGWPQD